MWKRDDSQFTEEKPEQPTNMTREAQSHKQQTQIGKTFKVWYYLLLTRMWGKLVTLLMIGKNVKCTDPFTGKL